MLKSLILFKCFVLNDYASCIKSILSQHTQGMEYRNKSIAKLKAQTKHNCTSNPLYNNIARKQLIYQNYFTVGCISTFSENYNCPYTSCKYKDKRQLKTRYRYTFVVIFIQNVSRLTLCNIKNTWNVIPLVAIMTNLMSSDTSFVFIRLIIRWTTV